MQFIKPGINIDFIGKRKIAFIVSSIMILISFASLIVHGGPRYGIDFAGGTLIQVKFSAPTAVDDIKSGLSTLGLKNLSVQMFGTRRGQRISHPYGQIPDDRPEVFRGGIHGPQVFHQK